MEQTANNDCQCNECKGACEYKPGWMKPGEAEKVAEFLEISLKELFDKYLGIDWWEADEDIFLLAPAIESMAPGTEYQAMPTGECVFFEEGKCKIHPVKPFECRAFHHTNKSEVKQSRHKEVADSWQEHQDQIKELLGREPESSTLNPFTFFDLMFTGLGYDCD